MKVAVRLFARARDLAGGDVVTVEVPAHATAGDLRAALTAVCPRLKAIIQHSALAINNEYADDAAVIPPAAEVALLPPVSGG